MDLDTAISKNENDSIKNKLDEDNFLRPSLPISSEKSTQQFKKSDDEKPQQQQQPVEAELRYTEPIWSRMPTISGGDAYHIEVVKNGSIIENIQLHEEEPKKSYLVIGRFDPCDIKLEHPSVSRTHAILQFGELTRGKRQWFTFDMSTHGVRVNKISIKKNTFVPLESGHVFQIAGSSRIFVLSGGPKIKEEEEKIEIKTNQQKISENKNADEKEDEAEEKHRFYEKDPMHWLEQYFEREGMPMEFKFTQSTTDGGSGGLMGLMSKKKAKKEGEIVDSTSNWICSIELVSDVSLVGGTMVTAMAPSRKLAQMQCALLACERLDEACLLQISSLWNKRKNYAENDFYEEDEDTFYDRTGQIEDQREKRKRRYQNDSSETVKAKTYDDLLKELDEVDKKLEVIKSEMDRLAGKDKYSTEEGTQKPALNFSTRMAISQIKNKEKKLMEEKARLTKLAAIAKPSHHHEFSNLTPTKSITMASSQIEEDTIQAVIEREIPVKREKMMEEIDEQPAKMDEIPPSTSFIAKTTETKEEKEESSDGIEKTKMAQQQQEERYYAPAMPSRAEAQKVAPKFGILTKDELVQMKMMQRHLDKEREERGGGGGRANEAKMQQQQQQEEEEERSYGSIEKYTTWMPPDDQKGDGSTRLNQKFAGKY